MTSVYELKSRFQNLLRPLTAALAHKGITANHVTISALVLSIIYGTSLCFGLAELWVLLPLFLFIRMAMNAIDGMLAREHDMSSKLGMALNETGDVVSDTALTIPFLFYAPHAASAILVFIFMAVLTEFCGILAHMISGNRRYDGPMGKSDRAVIMGILGFLIGIGVSLQTWVVWIFASMALLCLYSCLNRLRLAIRE